MPIRMIPILNRVAFSDLAKSDAVKAGRLGLLRRSSAVSRSRRPPVSPLNPSSARALPPPSQTAFHSTTASPRMGVGKERRHERRSDDESAKATRANATAALRERKERFVQSVHAPFYNHGNTCTR